MAERSIEQEEKEGEADGEDNEGEKSMNLGMERVDREGTVRVVITTATTSLLGQVGRKAIMGPRNDR